MTTTTTLVDEDVATLREFFNSPIEDIDRWRANHIALDRIVQRLRSLEVAAEDFVKKVESGRARSNDSYAKFKAALEVAENGEGSAGEADPALDFIVNSTMGENETIHYPNGKHTPPPDGSDEAVVRKGLKHEEGCPRGIWGEPDPCRCRHAEFLAAFERIIEQKKQLEENFVLRVDCTDEELLARAEAAEAKLAEETGRADYNFRSYERIKAKLARVEAFVSDRSKVEEIGGETDESWAAVDDYQKQLASILAGV